MFSKRMTSSTPVFKRSRPLLGTFLTIEIDSPELITQAFDEASRLEAKFSIFDPASEISRINAAAVGELTLTPEFAQVMQLARDINRESAYAFRLPDCELNGFVLTKKKSNDFFDLNGIAKGAIVDAVTDFILARAPATCGSVNAGGDLRQFGEKSAQVLLRLGALDRPLMRSLELRAESIATSSLTVATNDPHSRTRYPLVLRRGLAVDSSATVIAKKCAVADALTKVALFADATVIARCAEKFAARILIFDSKAQVVETYGEL